MSWREQVLRAQGLADIVEVRFDCLDDDQLSPAMEVVKTIRGKPLIATYRSSEQGGRRSIGPKERIDFWLGLGDEYAFVDLEQDIAGEVTATSRIIASHHDHSGTPDCLNAMYDALRAAPNVVKIATTAYDICDALPVWQLSPEQLRITNTSSPSQWAKPASGRGSSVSGTGRF